MAKSVGVREIDRAITDCDRIIQHLINIRNMADPDLHKKIIEDIDKYGTAVLLLQESLKDFKTIF